MTNTITIPNEFHETIKFLSQLNDFINVQMGEVFKACFEKENIPATNLEAKLLVVENGGYLIDYKNNDNNSGAILPVD